MEITKFEDALQKFGEACIDIESNEASFQAYYAHFVIKELEKTNRNSHKLVHREGHLLTHKLLNFIGGIKNCKVFELNKNPKINKNSKEKDLMKQVIPDLSVSQFQIDNRPSRGTRDTHFNKQFNKSVDWVLAQSIITELKVTVSVDNRHRPKDIQIDIAKLGLLATVYKKAAEQIKEIEKYKDFKYDMNTCMIILDNNDKSINGIPKYGQENMERLLAEIDDWPENVVAPTIYVILKKKGVVKIDKYVNWI